MIIPDITRETLITQDITRETLIIQDITRETLIIQDITRETLIITDSTKTEFNYCFIIPCFMENMQKMLCEMQVDFICASKNTKTNAPSDRITRNYSSARAL